MKPIVVTHVTHTDISKDSRVLKSIDAVSKIDSVTVSGIGISDHESYSKSVNGVKNLSLSTRKFFRRIPRVFRLATLAPMYIFLEFSYVLIRELLEQKPEVVHSHDYLALFPCLIYSRLTGAKLVYDAHELESEKNGSGKYSSKFVFLFEKFAWRYIDLFITVSDSIRGWYLKEFGKKRSEVVLNSPVLRSDSEANGESLREIFSIDDNKLVAVYVGLFVGGRGIEKILGLATSVDSIHFVFLGDGPLRSKIESQSKKFRNISIHPFVEHSRVVGLLNSADIGLCMLEDISLSDYYAIPNKLLEYAFSGLFILATNFPEMEKVVNEYKLGKCLPDDLDKSRNTLTTIQPTDIAKRKATDISELYSLTWEAQAAKLQASYLDLFEYMSRSN